MGAWHRYKDLLISYAKKLLKIANEGVIFLPGRHFWQRNTANLFTYAIGEGRMKKSGIEDRDFEMTMPQKVEEQKVWHR